MSYSILLVIISFCIAIVILVYLNVFYFGPEVQKRFEHEESLVNNLNCYDLGKYIVKNSINMISDNSNISIWNYAKAKYDTGDCKK